MTDQAISGVSEPEKVRVSLNVNGRPANVPLTGMVQSVVTSTYIQASLGVSDFALTILDDANATEVLATLGLTVSDYMKGLLDSADQAAFHADGDIQTKDATLTSLSALGTAADKIAYTTGIDTWAETAISSYGRTLINLADSAALADELTLVTPSQTDFFSCVIEYPEDGDYRFIVNAPYAFTVNEVTTISASGTATATFKINTTALGGGSNSVSTSEATVTHSSANSVSVGDDFVMTLSASTSVEFLTITVKITRTLASA